MPKEMTGLWIPKPILLNGSLTAPEKMLLGEVKALQKASGAFASNRHFAAILSVKERQVRNHISALVQKGMLRIENGTSRRRRMWVTEAAEAGNGNDNSYPFESLATADTTAEHGTQSPLSGEVTRQSLAGGPGTIGSVAARSDRVTRQGSATENTTRTLKENTRKNTSISNGVVDLPSWLPHSLWERWLQYNREHGRHLSPSTQEAQIRNLDGFRHSAKLEEIFDAAISEGWKNLYAPKQRRTAAASSKSMFSGNII